MNQTQLPGLHTQVLGRHYLHFERLESTNLYLKQHSDELPHGTAVTADCQFGGKGRMGKRWHGTAGESLALSVLLKDRRLEDMPLLPLLTGIAVRRVLDDLCNTAFSIKWSNDILYESRKVCGILCESRLTSHSASAVIGVGLNVLQTQEALTKVGLVYAASLYLVTGEKYPLSAITVLFLYELEQLLQEFDKKGFDGFREEYKQHCVNIGRMVQVNRDGQTVQAMAVDIAADGSLVCRDDGEQLFSVHAGETSVRGLYGYV